MDGRGRAQDNIFTERLWRTIKYEEVYLHEYQNPREARRRLGEYLTFYNYKRLHHAYRTPAEVYHAWLTRLSPLYFLALSRVAFYGNRLTATAGAALDRRPARKRADS